MNPGTEIRDALLDDTTLAGLVDERVYPSRLPPGDRNARLALFPCVVYKRVGGGPAVPTHDGPGSLAKWRWRFDCWAATHDDAETLGRATIAALTAASVGAEILGTMDGSEANAEVTGVWRVIVDAYAWQKNS